MVSPYQDPADPSPGADLETHRAAVVLLTNRRSARTSAAGGSALPLRDGIRVYAEGFDAGVVAEYATVVAEPLDADVALLRATASVLASGADELDRVLDVASSVPTVAVLSLDVPAVAAELADHCAALLAAFGAGDAAVLDVAFGRYAPTGRLPFDTDDALFRTGHGLTY